jgi:hypothetical protein
MEKNQTESTKSEQYKSVLSIFKEAFAKQLAAIANVPADQLLPMFDEAKSDDYLFSLALPKLKVGYSNKYALLILILWIVEL